VGGGGVCGGVWVWWGGLGGGMCYEMEGPPPAVPDISPIPEGTPWNRVRGLHRAAVVERGHRRVRRAADYFDWFGDVS